MGSVFGLEDIPERLTMAAVGGLTHTTVAPVCMPNAKRRCWQ